MKKYKCIKDKQSPKSKDGFCVGVIESARGWKKRALIWTSSDGYNDLYKWIKKQRANEKLVNFISDFWDIKLIKVK